MKHLDAARGALRNLRHASERDPKPEPLPQPRSNPYRDVGRNDPCPCRSGLKFKRCCGWAR